MTKLRKFVRAYLKDFNAKNAALSVGCSERSAYELGCRWLRKVKASGLYEEESRRVLEQAGVNVHNVLQELVKLASANIADFIKIDENGQADVSLAGLSREQLAAIQEITVDTTGGSGDGERRRVLRTRFKLADKGSNLERLLKYQAAGGFGQKQTVEHTGKDGGPIQTSIQVQFVTSDAANS